jgi:hypothetical protein
VPYQPGQEQHHNDADAELQNEIVIHELLQCTRIRYSGFSDGQFNEGCLPTQTRTSANRWTKSSYPESQYRTSPTVTRIPSAEFEYIRQMPEVLMYFPARQQLSFRDE